MPTSNADLLDQLIQRVRLAITTIRQADKLTLECMNAGRLAGARRLPWDDLLETFQLLGDSIDNATALTIRFAPSVSSTWPLPRQRKTSSDILAHVTKGRSLRKLRLIFRRSWKTFLAGCTVRGTNPQSLEDFQALNAYYQVKSDRDELRRRWELQIEPLGGLPAAQLGDRPEDTSRQLASRLRQSLDWNEHQWREIQTGLADIGLEWDRVLANTPPRSDHCGDLLQIADACEQHLLAMLQARNAYLQTQELANQLRHVETILTQSGNGRISRALDKAIRNQSATDYEAAWHELERVYGRTSAKFRREELLGRLAPAAPTWADAIGHRIPPHDKHTPPGDAHRAWHILQLQQELHRREQLDSDRLQLECTDLRDQLQQHTQRYVKHLAWAKQHERTDKHVQAALKGWLQTVSRRGYHSGVMSARLKEEARKLLNQARGAVPVWIMPLSRVVESYDFRVAQFDVVILDEASQCDMTGLVALGLAKQAVVVGDDKQVSPVAVGEDLQQIQTLIDEFLQGVSNAHLYTGRQSLYDMATYGFGKTIRLTEHFRCVPDIIQFSNQLSYDGEIKPLREFATVPTRPFVVAHRVADGYREGKTNEREALEVASLIAAAIEQPEYADMTIGVVSMLGEEQAVLIDSMLQKRLPASEYARRLLLCGIPPQFQGDERDVMFMTLVDGGRNGPLRSNANNDDSRKRFNVASSRARNQLWVVHSLNHATDVQPEDFRRRLIQHALDPQATERQVASSIGRADSEFERQVIRRLSDAGYRIVPQWHVGAFRIDIVVIGPNNSRAAIECDGDRFHPPDKLDEDLARQRILERLGWRFIRVRGTSFFREPELAMRTVFRRLTDLQVNPIGATPSDTSLAEGSDEGLLGRLKRRADELRRTWSIEEEGTDANGDETHVETPPYMPSEPTRSSVPDRLSHLVNLRVSPASLTDNAYGILSCLREASRPLSRSEIIERLGIDTNTWNFSIRKLVQERLVLRQGDKRGARYSIPQE
ncbi:MAG: AAA domain-containing protein [Patescibacteria group bacterium]